MLPESITLTPDGGTTNETFASPRDTPNGKVFLAPSPNGDIAGAPSLRVETTRTSKGIERTLAQIVRPVMDASGKYTNYITVSLVINRHVSLTTSDVKEDIVKMLSLSPDVADSMAVAQL